MKGYKVVATFATATGRRLEVRKRGVNLDLIEVWSQDDNNDPAWERHGTEAATFKGYARLLTLMASLIGEYHGHGLHKEDIK